MDLRGVLSCVQAQLSIGQASLRRRVESGNQLSVAPELRHRRILRRLFAVDRRVALRKYRLRVSRVRLLELLGLHASASREEIRSRYRELARKFHPDVNGGDERSHARFRAIAAAYEELLAVETDAGSPRECAAYTPPAVEVARSHDLDRDIATRTPATPSGSDGGLARRHAEARSRLGQCKKTVHRVQADVRDGDAKALAARRRGDDQLARHFERRVEADRSRVYALLGEISVLERELRGLEAGLVSGDGNGQAMRIPSESRLDPGERLNSEVQKVHDEERAVLKKKYESDGRRR